MHITAKISDRREIEPFLLDAELYDRITDDNCPSMENFVFPEAGYIIIAGYVDNKIASMFIVHDGKMHFMVLKPYRKYARLLLSESFRLHPFGVYVEIPSCYMAVVNFAKRCGFRELRIDAGAHKKNGNLYNVHTLSYEV